MTTTASGINLPQDGDEAFLLRERDKPRVAVLLAAFNGTAWIERQIDSVLAQQGVEVTLFISVDVSRDGTEELVDAVAARDARVCVLPHGKRFGGAARNFFRLLCEVDLKGFDHVSFADQDDIWQPEKLLRACSLLAQRAADAYSSDVMAFWPSGREMLIRKSQPQRQWDFLFEAAGPGCTYVLSDKLARDLQACLRGSWSAFQDVGLHDWFAYAFARAHGYQWIIDEYAGVWYRQHDDNQVGVNAGLAAFMSRARKVMSGWGLEQAALIARLVGLEGHPFVRRWADGSRRGLLWLALRHRACRRRPRDQALFALSCLCMAVWAQRR